MNSKNVCFGFKFPVCCSLEYNVLQFLYCFKNKSPLCQNNKLINLKGVRNMSQLFNKVVVPRKLKVKESDLKLHLPEHLEFPFKKFGFDSLR